MRTNYNIEVRGWAIPIFIGCLIGAIFHPLFLLGAISSIALMIRIYNSDNEYERNRQL
jgi:hypothetical protein